MRFLLYKTLKDKRRLGKIAVFNCILYDASRRMANKLLFYSILYEKYLIILMPNTSKLHFFREFTRNACKNDFFREIVFDNESFFVKICSVTKVNCKLTIFT